MDITAIFATSFMLGLTGAMMPGPLLVVTVGDTVRRGFWAGPLIILGHAILELALVVLLVLGLASVLTREQTQIIIGIVGGLFLLYFGYTMSRDAFRGRVTLDLDGDAGDMSAQTKGMHPVAAGILVSMSNPYWIMWWATVGLAYITEALKRGNSGVVSFYSGHIMADLAWYGLVAAVVAGGSRFISQRAYNNVLVVCGLFVFGLGLYFIRGAIMNLV